MSEKIRNAISKVGIVIGILFFGICYINILMQSMQKDIKVILLMLVMFGILLFINFRRTKDRKTFYCMMSIMVLLQLVVGYLGMVEYSTWDVYTVYNNAVRLATQSEDFSHIYFDAHPNNIMLLFILTALYKVAYTLFGTTSIYVAIVLNIVFIDVGLFCALKVAEIIGGKDLKYKFGVFCTLFAPFYLWTPIVYTDTMCFPFLMGGIFLLIKAVELAEERQITKGVGLYFVLFGLVVEFGIKMKGSLAILLVSGIIYLFLKWNIFDKKGIGKICKSCMLCFAGVFLGSIIFSSIVNSTGLFTEENFYKYEYPKSHYIMMGLKGMGNFNGEDNAWTGSIDGYEEKKEAIKIEIEKRIEAGGSTYVLKQMLNKAINYGWNYGTYYAERYLGDYGDVPVSYNWLHEIILSRGKYFEIHWLYTQSFYLLIFGMSICSFFVQIISHKMNFEIVFLEVSLIGALLFFMFWETHPRYLLHFAPVLLLTAAYTLITFRTKIVDWKNSYLQKIKELKDGEVN